ncbi:hypothetical protein CAter282_3699 [Collimonas arenae]|uniref:Uncharacterized protein n=1 Tax=Collimonas arenae TaxID=279058 RepID=A0A127PUI4_9BURK|nr:hypothetical protein CAter10_4043 [Collimonas arenae]AMP11382.1 hypothetical protein CAter282_3699 [Collimonas arenae]
MANWLQPSKEDEIVVAGRDIPFRNVAQAPCAKTGNYGEGNASGKNEHGRLLYSHECAKFVR